MIDFSKTTKEDIEFAEFATHEFATWGFINLGKVIKKQKPYKEYLQEMLLLVLTHFQGDAPKAWRFLKSNLTDKEYQDCEKYVVYARQELVKNGWIKED